MPKPEIKTIDVQELKSRMELDNDLVLIDVRELHEWNKMHIPGAVHIPKDLIKQNITNEVSDKSHPVYLHCQAGVRSLYAAQALLEMGYENVYSINGGISEWANRGFEVQSEG